MDNEYWDIISKKLLKLGFNCDNNFLLKLHVKDRLYIEKKILELPLITCKDNSLLTRFNLENNMENQYEILNLLNKGNYNEIYLIRDIISDIEHVYRYEINNKNNEKNNINNYIQGFVYAFLSEYQKTYFKINGIVKIKHICYDPKLNTISTICKKMNNTLGFLLNKKNITMEEKIKFLIKALFEIIYYLKKLQKKFKFVHNDLLFNNVFYSDKNEPPNIDTIKFYIGDMDNCYLEINNYPISGYLIFNTDDKFNNKKDLFILFHSLYYSFNSAEWDELFFNKFPIYRRVKNNQPFFHSLYKIREINIYDIFNPIIMKKYLKRQFT